MGPAPAYTVGPQGASGTSYLCWGYAGCARAGMGNAGYASVSRTMYWRMYGGHNCTNYAAYRMIRSGMPNVRPWSGSGNATNWGTAMSRITDGTPRVGAVAWWRAYVSPAGSAGHVAYVERVVDANTIVVSQDSWGGDFSWKRLTRGGGQWPSGFVHFNDRAQRNTARPSISGTPKVGSTLSATRGSWALSGASFRYQWRAGGVAIAGATGSTLLLRQAQAGKRVTVRVTAVTAGYPNVGATSDATATVIAAAVRNTALPSISGTTRVGAVLSASSGAWTPSDATLRYQWRSGGSPLVGRTGPTLRLTPALLGRQVRVQVTATRTGLSPAVASSVASGVIRPGRITLTTAPTITGTPRPGQTLTVRSGTVTPQDAGLSFQWLRDGVPLTGATAATRQLVFADLGHSLTVRVTASRVGYDPLRVVTPVSVHVRSAPVFRVALTPGHRTLGLTATASAPGVSRLDGVVAVRLADGALLGTFPVRAGTGSVTLREMPVGTHTFRVRLRLSDEVERATLYRQATILR